MENDRIIPQIAKSVKLSFLLIKKSNLMPIIHINRDIWGHQVQEGDFRIGEI